MPVTFFYHMGDDLGKMSCTVINDTSPAASSRPPVICCCRVVSDSSVTKPCHHKKPIDLAESSGLVVFYTYWIENKVTTLYNYVSPIQMNLHHYITNLATRLMSVRSFHSSSFNIFETLLSHEQSTTTNLAAFLWILLSAFMSFVQWGFHKVALYFRLEHTREKYASSFSLHEGHIWRFLPGKPMVQLAIALEVISDMWVSHFMTNVNSHVFAYESTFFKIWPQRE